MVELEIDGSKVEVQEGAMVMEAAHKIGVSIPHFCYHKKLSIAANCRMCLVEVEKAPKPLPACATPVSAGMIVRTQSVKAKDAQKAVMEFLLINHPLDCPICDQGGECQLQDLAVGYGNGVSRYTEEKRVVFHKNVGPLISMEEMSRCIHCTRCVRFGQEIAGVMELGMLGRGEHSEITAFLGQGVDSELSGNMIDICPVGALTSKPFRYAARSWELARRRSISPHDSLGSNLIAQVKNNTVMRVVPFENETLNECWIADRDRFSYEGLNTEDRLRTPQIKKDGKWCVASWDEALTHVSRRLQDIQKQDGAQSIQALAHPMSTFEEFSLLGQVMHGLGSDQIDANLLRPDTGVIQWLGCDLAEFSALECVLIVGANLRADQPLLTARLRQMTKRNTQLNIINAFDDESLVKLQNQWLSAPSAWVDSLAQIHSAILKSKNQTPSYDLEVSAEAQAIGQSLLSGQAGIFVGSIAAAHPEAASIQELVRAIGQLLNAKTGYLTEGANRIGAQIALPKPVAIGQEAKAILLWHCEADDFAPRSAFLNKVDSAQFVVAFSCYQHAQEYAEVMLPIAPFTETSGSFINLTGLVQSFNGVAMPLGETRPGWKVLRVLGNLLDLPKFNFNSSEAVRDDLLQNRRNLTEFLTAETASSQNRSVSLSGKTKHSVDNTVERVPSFGLYQRDGITRRAESLQKTTAAKSKTALISHQTATRLQLKDGDHLAFSASNGRAVHPIKIARPGQLAEGIVHLPVMSENADLPLFATLTLEKM